MVLFVTLTEFLLYISFSILFGSTILLLVPEKYKPDLHIPKQLLYIATGTVFITALFPVIRTAEIFSTERNMWFIFKNVLFTFDVGQSWVFIAVISVILIRVLLFKGYKTNPWLLGTSIFLTLLMLLAYTKSSHAASITEWQGFYAHTLHFLAVSVWIGILFMVSWFSKDHRNWGDFIKWYTPVALICLIVVSVAGYFTMSIDINSYDNPSASVFQEYQNSLTVNYGQALLFKHLFIISIVLFAVINGIIYRVRKNNESFHPLKWARTESIFAIVAFTFTAFMGQSWPPHQLYSLIKSYGASPLFTTFTQSEMVSQIMTAESLEIFNVSMSFSTLSYLFLVIGLFFLSLIFVAVFKRSSVAMAFISACLMVASFYFSIMTAIQ
ncbi:copper resistance D family protein [Halobacillus litoralis]|uniref:copper resistance D family protein n=1 Tax=Halobacillus litoralis TaxID=45668 RepID=UPI0024924845|nr:hypothetical protein [Halobacillus litoralis]